MLCRKQHYYILCFIFAFFSFPIFSSSFLLGYFFIQINTLHIYTKEKIAFNICRINRIIKQINWKLNAMNVIYNIHGYLTVCILYTEIQDDDDEGVLCYTEIKLITNAFCSSVSTQYQSNVRSQFSFTKFGLCDVLLAPIYFPVSCFFISCACITCYGEKNSSTITNHHPPKNILHTLICLQMNFYIFLHFLLHFVYGFFVAFLVEMVKMYNIRI